MRKLKGSGNYVRTQTWKNLGKGTLCLAFFGLVFFLAFVEALYFWRFGIFEVVLLLLSLVPLGAGYYFLRKFRIYRGGLDGEKAVAKYLSGALSDEYFLINGLSLVGSDGDIDHVVLGPNGVFVLETKNWSGQISCFGDDWQREGKRNSNGSPSRQAKRNASRVRNVLEAHGAFRVWVEGIVVFTNSHAELHISSPSCPVLRLNQLPVHVLNRRGSASFSGQQLEMMGKEILKSKR